jgi:hypothetical protein
MPIDAKAQELFRKKVLLSNGATVSISRAAILLSLLEDYFNSEIPSDRETMVALRQFCLGVPITDDARKLLIQERFLDQDRGLDDDLKQIVLSAFKGQDYGLSLQPPFTDSWDRIVAEMMILRDRIRHEIGKEFADVLLNEPGFGGDYNTADQIGGWTEFVKRKRDAANRGRPSTPKS